MDLASYDICSVPTTKKIFTSFPEIFKGGKWMDSTKVCCWNCTLQFDGRPVAVPVDEEHFIGIFCTWNCAKRYILTEKRSNMQFQLLKLSVLAKSDVVPAPTRYMMTKFGGPMTTTQYKSLCNKQQIELIEQNYKPSTLAVVTKKKSKRRHDGLYHEYLRMQTMESNSTCSSSSGSSCSSSSSSRCGGDTTK